MKTKYFCIIFILLLMALIYPFFTIVDDDDDHYVRRCYRYIPRQINGLEQQINDIVTGSVKVYTCNS
jgi:hypothetical protein